MELARAADIDQASMSNYELEKRELRVPALIQIAGALNVPVDELIGREHHPPAERFEMLISRDSALGSAILVLRATNGDGSPSAEDALHAISFRSRTSVSRAAQLGTDLADAAESVVAFAVEEARVLNLDECELASWAGRVAIAECGRVSHLAGLRVRRQLLSRHPNLALDR